MLSNIIIFKAVTSSAKLYSQFKFFNFAVKLNQRLNKNSCYKYNLFSSQLKINIFPIYRFQAVQRSFSFYYFDDFSCNILLNYQSSLIAMSDEEQNNNGEEEEKPPQLPFCLDYDKMGRAKCKRCKLGFDKGESSLDIAIIC